MRILFCNCFHGQTGTTSNMAAIASYIALQHPYKLVLMQSQFTKNYMEESLYHGERFEENPGQENGMDAMFRMMKSEPITKDMIDSCSIQLYRNRFYLLPPTIQQDSSMYEMNITPILVYCMNAVNLYYDVVFLDAGTIQDWQKNRLLESADLVVMNLSQNEHALKSCFSMEFCQRKNLFFLIGNYDPVSKYNLVYLCKRYKIPLGRVGVLPYNSMFRDSYSDGQIVKFMSQIIESTKDEMNYYFITEVAKTAQKMMDLCQKQADRRKKKSDRNKKTETGREVQ